MARGLPHPMSREAWREWASETERSEWVDGEVVTFMPPSRIHQLLVVWLTQVLGLFARRSGIGELVVAPFEMRLPRSSREPDLMIVARERLHLLGPQRLDGPADLVVEIVSDDSTSRDRVGKLNEYESAGVREYWIIDPREGRRSVALFLLDEAGRYRQARPDDAGRLHSTVLAGLWLDPAMLWQEPLPDPLDVLFALDPRRFPPAGV